GVGNVYDGVCAPCEEARPKESDSESQIHYGGEQGDDDSQNQPEMPLTVAQVRLKQVGDDITDHRQQRRAEQKKNGEARREEQFKHLRCRSLLHILFYSLVLSDAAAPPRATPASSESPPPRTAAACCRRWGAVEAPRGSSPSAH